MSDQAEEENAIDFIEKWGWSPGSLFWVKRSGKKVSLLSLGERVDFDYLKKFRKFQLEFTDKIKTEWMDEGIELISKLKDIDHLQGNRELERSQLRESLIEWVRPVMWTGEKNKYGFELVNVFFHSFLNLEDSLINEYNLLEDDLAFRSALVASLSTLLSLICGYTSYQFLENLFNTTLLSKICFTKIKPSSYQFEYFEKERIHLGSGVDWLRGQRIEERNTIDYLNLSIQDVSELSTKEELNFSLIKTIYEKMNGKGALGLNQNELSDLEACLILSEGLIPFEKEFSTKQKIKSLISSMISGKEMENLVWPILAIRVKGIIDKEFERENDDRDKYIEVVGI